MLFSLFASALLTLFPTVSAISSSECSNPPYKEILPLSNFPPALSFCSAHFPLPPCTSTKTISSTCQSTVYTTSTSTSTTTTGTTVVSKVSTTDSVVTVSTTDATVTQTVSTVTIITTVTLQQRKRAHTTTSGKKSSTTTTSKTTLSTTTSKTSNNPSKTTTAGTGVSAIWASLEAAGLSIIAEACTCIETQPSCKTVTSVVTTTLPPITLPTVTTVTTSVEATTIVSGLTTETITTTIDVTSTISVTATITIESDIPFYTLIGQYDPGCTLQDGSNTHDTTDLSSTDSSTAIAECKTFCTGEPLCEAIFVQYLYPDPADVPKNSYSRWVCYYANTNSAYNGASNVVCGQPVGVYGSAYLYQNARYTAKG